MTTEERLDRVEEAIKALAILAMAPPYMGARKQAADDTIVRIYAELDAYEREAAPAAN
jgi:hypothetical protein